MKHRRRKIITRVIVFLLLGAIVNVAVSICLSFVRNNTDIERPVLISESTEDPIVDTFIRALNGVQMPVFGFEASSDGLIRRWYVPTNVGVAFGVTSPPHEMKPIGLKSKWEATVSATLIDRRDLQVPSIEYVETGWPYSSFKGHVLTTFNVANDFSVPLETIGFRAKGVRAPGGYYVGVPYQPIWPELLVNTTVYGATLWILFATGRVPFVMTRRRRIKRGLCPACAYPVGGSPVCTECGAAVVR